MPVQGPGGAREVKINGRLLKIYDVSMPPVMTYAATVVPRNPSDPRREG